MKNVLLMLTILGPLGLFAQPSWIYVGFYPWVYDSNDGWMVTDINMLNLYDEFGIKKAVLGNEPQSYNPETLEGLEWTLTHQTDGSIWNTTMIYLPYLDTYDQAVLQIDEPFLTPPSWSPVGFGFVWSVNTFELADGSFQIIGTGSGSGLTFFEFNFTEEGAGTFSATIAYPRPIRVIEGIFTVKEQ